MRTYAPGTYYRPTNYWNGSKVVSPPAAPVTYTTPTGSLTINKNGTVTPSGTPPTTTSPPKTPTPWQQFITSWNQFTSDFMQWMAKL